MAGATLAALGLAGVTYALTEGPSGGWAAPATAILGVAGLVLLAAFVLVEMRSPHPMIPLGIFSSRLFTAANIVTLVVYAALGGALFLLPIQLQVVIGLQPAGGGGRPLPADPRDAAAVGAGRAAGAAIGPRIPMTVGPLVAAVGLLLMVRVGPDADYVTDILPAILVFSLGLSMVVAPLTATVLGAASEENAGVASAPSTPTSPAWRACWPWP